MGSITFVKENGITYMLIDGKKVVGALSGSLAKPHTFNEPNAVEIDSNIISDTGGSYIPITEEIETELEKMKNAECVHINGYYLKLISWDEYGFLFGARGQIYGSELGITIDNNTIKIGWYEV